VSQGSRCGPRRCTRLWSNCWPAWRAPASNGTIMWTPSFFYHHAHLRSPPETHTHTHTPPQQQQQHNHQGRAADRRCVSRLPGKCLVPTRWRRRWRRRSSVRVPIGWMRLPRASIRCAAACAQCSRRRSRLDRRRRREARVGPSPALRKETERVHDVLYCMQPND
jgi:hypothetical protein